MTNIENHYDCDKGKLSINAVLEHQMSEFVETQVNYILDEFSTFAQIRMTHKPEKDTSVELMFIRKVDTVIVLAGKGSG